LNSNVHSIPDACDDCKKYNFYTVHNSLVFKTNVLRIDTKRITQRF